MGELEARKSELEAQLEDATEEPVLLHSNTAEFYRQEVRALREALTDDNYRTEAAALMRGLVDKIVLTPIEHEDRKTLSIDLHGDIAGILAMASHKDGKAEKPSARFCRGDGFAEESI